MSSSAMQAFGINARPLTPEEKSQYRTPNGILVLGTKPSSIVMGIIKKGDIIINVDGKPVDSTKDLEKELQKTDHLLRMKILRGSGVMYLAISIEEHR